MPRPSRASRASTELLPARIGAGRYLERDYWAVIPPCRRRPSELMRSVRERFAELAPGELVSFRRVGNGSGELALGDELEVQIAGVGKV